MTFERKRLSSGGLTGRRKTVMVDIAITCFNLSAGHQDVEGLGPYAADDDSDLALLNSANAMIIIDNNDQNTASFRSDNPRLALDLP